MVLGYVNARVILTIALRVVLTPLALVWRLIGRDPLAIKQRHWPGWSPYPARYRRPAIISRRCIEGVSHGKESRAFRVHRSSCARKRSTG